MLVVFAIFHGAILRPIVHAIAVKVAAGQNLKLETRVEGGILGGITLRNVHATATGPSAVQSLDADLIHAEYSLTGLLFHGMSDFLQDVELRDVTAVLDPSKAPIPTPTPPPKPNEKVSLPAFFPDRLVLKNVNLTIKGQPQDTVVKNLNLGLFPKREGALKIDKLQISGVNTWTDITATTTYANKNLYLHNLVLDAQNKLQTVNLDASKIGQGKVALNVEGTLGGGEVKTKIDLSTKGSNYQTDTNVHAKDISLGKLGELIGKSPGDFSGDVKNADIELKGSLDQPSSWDGTINADLKDVKAGNFSLDQVKVDVKAQNGKATVREARIDQGKNHIELKGSVDLPKSADAFGTTPGNLQISVDAPELKDLTSFMSEPATGSLQANGNLKTGNGAANLDLKASGDQIEFQGAKVGKLSADISATKKMTPPQTAKNEKTQPSPQPFYDGVNSNIQTKLEDVRYGDFVIDEVQGQVKSNGDKVSLSPLTATRKGNVLEVNGNFQLPGPNEKLLSQPADLQFNLRAPQLADYWQSGAPDKVTGQMQASGNVEIRKGVANGKIELHGSEIAAKDLIVKNVDLQTEIKNDVVHLNNFTATLNDEDYIKAHGTVKLQKPYPYDGAVTAHLGKLSTFEPLLSGPEKKTQLAGSLVLDWKGQGDASTFPNHGDLNLKLEQGRYGDLQKLEAKIEAHYTAEQLNVPIVFFASDKLGLQASIQTKDSRLEISNIAINQGESKYASGYAAFPFNWSNLGTKKPLFPDNGKVSINLQSKDLDLAKLFRDLGMEPPVAGQLSLNLDAQGALDQLQASLDLQLQNVKADAAAQLKPTDVNFALRLQNNQLKVDGKIQQPLIQPITITAQLPLNVSEVLAKKKVDEQTPVSAKVEMPRSSINFVREFVPALRQLDGSIALNVNVGGTIAHPALSGAADMNILMARFENATLPALTNFKAQLNFRDNTLRFDRFGGDLAGGPFTLSGSLSFPKLTEPTFDLHLKANSVLVARNDNLTARVDADIKIAGPFNSASVSGQVLTTNSRFLKNIDIVPISLPGRPAPLPDPPSAAPALTFPNPPLRDWKFDVAIKSKEPFLIRGNLAAGSANIDMRMAGTGLHPQLQGQVRLENFEATLPFSTLTINLGFLYFDPDDPLNPRIEMQGTSLIQDYTVHVYIYGTALNPEAAFSSEPPLPQEDIIALLATGVTRENLSSNVLASRGLLLLGKELYRKVFKKNSDEKPKTDSIFNRLSVEYSGADTRTGEQTATAKYKVSDHVLLIGDIGIAGGFRGIVKYVIRFR